MTKRPNFHNPSSHVHIAWASNVFSPTNNHSDIYGNDTGRFISHRFYAFNSFFCALLFVWNAMHARGGSFSTAFQSKWVLCSLCVYFLVLFLFYSECFPCVFRLCVCFCRPVFNPLRKLNGKNCQLIIKTWQFSLQHWRTMNMYRRPKCTWRNAVACDNCFCHSFESFNFLLAWHSERSAERLLPATEWMAANAMCWHFPKVLSGRALRLIAVGGEG